MRMEIDPAKVTGLGDYERTALSRLEKIYNAHESANRKKEKYYEGNIPLSDVNLGLALPDRITKLEIGCAWGGKTVDVLAARSMFDGYVGVNGESMELLNKIVAGSPDVKRRGISGYNIEKIVCDKTATKFVIIVEKISEEENAAPSVRYMVETFVLK